VHRGHQM